MSKGDGNGAGPPSSLPLPIASLSRSFDLISGVEPNHRNERRRRARVRSKCAVINCIAVRSRTLPSIGFFLKISLQLNGNGMKNLQCQPNERRSVGFEGFVLDAGGQELGSRESVVRRMVGTADSIRAVAPLKRYKQANGKQTR